MSARIPIHEVVSLGSFCGVAEYARRKGYRKASYPFDWLFTDVPFVLSNLESDFANFFESQQGVRKRSGQDAVCRRFVHHNTSTQKDRDYFMRCIDRFRKLSESRGTTLFLGIVDKEQNETVEKGILPMHESLRKYAGDKFVLCVVNVRYSKTPKECVLDKHSDSLYVFEMNSYENLDGTSPFNIPENMHRFETMLHGLFEFEKHATKGQKVFDST